MKSIDFVFKETKKKTSALSNLGKYVNYSIYLYRLIITLRALESRIFTFK
jgi:hypothetical protein